ncbi:PHP domain-containing protein [Traorella massiliensis]|uniref:PHP domain-containing protein n=1 Tax=Traorella massiliensis TaxID=1903263 RepID=UPI00137A2939|nr:PHP domain-containing protein [Traorella massiliensis]
MKKVDLHIHSMYSDGTYTVNEIIERAKENQVELIFICDHSCIEAYDELENKKLDVKILPGVEIDSVDDYIDFHILGYNFDIHDQQFKKFIEENNSRLELVNVKLLEKVIRDHPALSLQEYRNFSYD